jgi:hypothetical protein
MTIREPLTSSRPRVPRSIRPNAMPKTTTKRQRSTAVNIGTSLQILNEALSRARTRRPQEVGTSGAYRSARQIAMNARREQTRLLGE